MNQGPDVEKLYIEDQRNKYLVGKNMKGRKNILQKSALVLLVGLFLIPSVQADNGVNTGPNEVSWGFILYHRCDYEVTEWITNISYWNTSLNMSFVVIGIGRHNISWQFAIDGYNKNGQHVTATLEGYEHLYMFQISQPHMHMRLRKNIGTTFECLKNATLQGTLYADGNILNHDTVRFESPWY